MFTLGDFLNLDIMSRAEVVTNPMNYATMTIDYISVQEPPVEGFVRENEIVLSTATGLMNENCLLEFVQDIIQSKSSGLILSFHPGTNQVISQKVIDFANHHQFPLIEIPWDLRFSNVIENVMTEIQKKESSQENLYSHLQKKLLHLYFSGKSLEDAAKLIGQTLDCSVMIMDKDQNTKGAYANGGEKHYYKIQIEMYDYLYGFLYVSKAADEKNHSIHLNLYNFYINIPLSLWFEKEEVVNTTSLKIANDFVWQLANDKNQSKNLISQGIQLGFNMDARYFCILFKIHRDHYLNHTKDSTYSSNFMTIENKILSFLKAEHLSAMLGLKEQTFILFVEDQNKMDLGILLNKLEQMILEIYPKYRFHWGLSEKPQADFSFSDQYEKAKIALDQALNLGLPLLTYKQSQITRIVNQLISRDEARQQAHSLFAPITSHPRFNEEGMDLMKTLIVYLKSNLNTSETARKLNIHRQSLLYRFEKLEELTKLSLTDIDDLFLLQYYLRLLGLFREE